MSVPTPQGHGEGRVGIVEGWELRQSRKQDANSGAFKGLAFVVVALLLLVVGGWFAARPVLGPALSGIFEDYPGMVNVPVVSDLLAAEFADRLDKPAGSSEAEVEFVVEGGQSVDDITENLVEAGLLTDEMAFKYAVVDNRVDQLIKAGVYTMTPRITPAGIAGRLEGDPDPPTPLTVLDMRHGRRIEQIVAYLQQQTENTELELDPKEFLRLTRNPAAALRKQYRFLAEAPADNSLEGFLAGGTYEVPVDTTAEELMHQMLGRWESANAKYVTLAAKRGYDFYEALTIASLVEREAKEDSDRKKIAGVYWNRLDPKVNKQTGGLMQADPTVVYATDAMTLEETNVKDWDEYLFWDLLGRSDYSTVDVDKQYQSFQTYQNPGLPDWPIVTPSGEVHRGRAEPDHQVQEPVLLRLPRCRHAQVRQDLQAAPSQYRQVPVAAAAVP